VTEAGAPPALERNSAQADSERPADRRPSAGAAEATRAAKKKPAARPSAPPPKARNASALSRDCIPPHVIDRQGVRHPKPECL